MPEQLINYCDGCAEEYGYPQGDKIKGKCELCARVGKVNQVKRTSIVDISNLNKETWSGGGFKVEQLIPFPTPQNRETVHPTLTYKILTGRIVVYYDKNVIILSDIKTGQQIQITF